MKKTIKIAIASDLHLQSFSSEYRKDFMRTDTPPDILVLAGDVSGGTHNSINTILEIAKRYPEPHIVCVAGNHEHYYNNSLNESVQQLREAFEENDKIHFLENDRLRLLGLTFIGCTLWTDFSILGETEEAMAESEERIADFIYIQTQPNVKFRPIEAATLFMESYEFLDQNLATSDPEKTVVITHFPPGMATRNTNFNIDPITAYFQANVDHLIASYQPRLWIYGHNHLSCDQYLGKTQLVSNQLGYPSEPDYVTKFDHKKIIEIEVE
jgi:Icc-related predicted phosphoesterase